MLSGSLPGGIRRSLITDLLIELAAAGARIVVDCSGEGLRAAGPVADLVKINRAEASELLGADMADAASAATAISQLWGRDVVVTDGIRGGAAHLGGVDLSFDPPRAGRALSGRER